MNANISFSLNNYEKVLIEFAYQEYCLFDQRKSRTEFVSGSLWYVLCTYVVFSLQCLMPLLLFLKYLHIDASPKVPKRANEERMP